MAKRGRFCLSFRPGEVVASKVFTFSSLELEQAQLVQAAEKLYFAIGFEGAWL
jgi:hypothetical protein